MWLLVLMYFVFYMLVSYRLSQLNKKGVEAAQIRIYEFIDRLERVEDISDEILLNLKSTRQQVSFLLGAYYKTYHMKFFVHLIWMTPLVVLLEIFDVDIFEQKYIKTIENSAFEVLSCFVLVNIHKKLEIGDSL